MSKDGRFSKEAPLTVSSTLIAPPGACDCHGHIFPDRQLYPTGNETMPLSPIEFYLDVHAQLGIERGVIVQGGAYKFDNSAMLEALDRYPKALRGVALVPANSSEDDLASIAARQVRALRFTKGGASKIDSFTEIAPKMRALNLHAEMYIGLENFLDRSAALLAEGVPLVLDHLAGPFDSAIGVDNAEFRSLLDLLANEDIWVKLTPQRNSSQFPGYADVRPFQDALIAARPDRLVWGSDWPFPNMSEETPDLGDLASIFGEWVSDAGLRQQILVDNAARLYAFG